MGYCHYDFSEGFYTKQRFKYSICHCVIYCILPLNVRTLGLKQHVILQQIQSSSCQMCRKIHFFAKMSFYVVFCVAWSVVSPHKGCIILLRHYLCLPYNYFTSKYWLSSSHISISLITDLLCLHPVQKLTVGPYDNASIYSTNIHMYHSVPMHVSTLPSLNKGRLSAHVAWNCNRSVYFPVPRNKSLPYSVLHQYTRKTWRTTQKPRSWPQAIVSYIYFTINIMRHSANAFESSNQETERATSTLGHNLVFDIEVKLLLHRPGP